MPRKRTTTTQPDLSHIHQDLRHLAVPIADLHPDPLNARTHPDDNVKAIMASLERFGQRFPLVARKDGARLSAGHGRIEAMQRMGWTHAAALFVDESEHEARAFALADNRTAELAGWDNARLTQLLSDTPPELLPFTGFDQTFIDDLQERTNPAAVTEDEAPAPAAKAVTRRGDLWLLGSHRLLCGDSTDPKDMDRLMNGQKAALCATDPPYLVDYTGERPNDAGKDWSGSYDEVSIGKDAAGFFTKTFQQIMRALAAKAPIYCWHAHKRAQLIATIWDRLGILNHQQIIWVKPNSVFGRVFWHSRHEPCMMGWRKGSQPTHNGVHGHNSVWTDIGQAKLEDLSKDQLLAYIKDSSSVWELNWEGNKNRPVGYEHPTPKPVEIFARPMRKHTSKGAVCLEPFSGSGSQLSAAEQTGRVCHAMELSPIFVDVAVRRWQNLTGRKATLAESNKTWAQVAKQRKVAIDGEG